MRDREIFAKVRLKLYLADVVVLAVEVGVGVQLPRHLVHGDEGGRGEVEDTAWGECFDFKRTPTFRKSPISHVLTSAKVDATQKEHKC